MTQGASFNPPGRRHVMDTLDHQFNERQSEQIQRATFISAVGGLAIIQRDGQPSPDTTAYPVLGSITAIAGEYVLIFKVGAGYVVDGRKINTV